MGLEAGIARLLDSQEKESITLAACLWLGHGGEGQTTLHGEREYTLSVTGKDLWIYAGTTSGDLRYSETLIVVSHITGMRVVTSI